MKRKYIKPNTILDFISTNIMDTFSLPTTGIIDNPSLGQANEFDFDENESDNGLPEFHIWDEL